jgi:hypothetical protein
MKYIFLFLLLISGAGVHAQTKDVLVKFNAGFGSLIDSIDIAGKTYYAASLIKIPSNKVSDVTVYVTCDNNGAKPTYLQLVLSNGILTQQIIFRNQARKLGSRKSAGTFRAVQLKNLDRIILNEQ